MRLEEEHIRRLVIEELSGTISEDEAAWLRHSIAEDAEVRETYTRLREELNTREIHDALNELDNVLSAEQLLTTIKRKKKAKNRRLIGRIALPLVLIALAYFTFKPNRTPPLLATNISHKDIVLHLPDGKVVPLSPENQQMRVGSITFNNAGKKLTYSTKDDKAAAYAVLNVPVGKDYKVQLSDGTVIWLNSASSLRFPFTFNEARREVTITGEAYFDVTKSSTQPFIVQMPNGSVEVLGTTFNVNSYDTTQLKVAVVSGSVRMEAGGTAIPIQPGYQATYDRQKGIKMTTFEEDKLLGWQQGVYEYDNERLEEIIPVLSRWFNVTTVLNNPETGRRRFTGIINKHTPLETNLKNLTDTRDFNYYFDTDSVLHIK